MPSCTFATTSLEIGTFLLRSTGALDAVLEYDRFLHAHSSDWFIREVLHLWKRVLKRVDLTSRTIMTLVEPHGCFAGFLAELLLAADRSYMFQGVLEGEETSAALLFTQSSTSILTTSQDLTRIERDSGETMSGKSERWRRSVCR